MLMYSITAQIEYFVYIMRHNPNAKNLYVIVHVYTKLVKLHILTHYISFSNNHNIYK